MIVASDEGCASLLAVVVGSPFDREGAADEEQHKADVTWMTHNGVRAGVNDFVATVRLNAHGLLEKLVHGLRPGQDANSDHEQDITDAADPPGHWQPAPPVVQCRDQKDGIHRRNENAQQDSVPAFGPPVKANPRQHDFGVHTPDVQAGNHQSTEEEADEEALGVHVQVTPSAPPCSRHEPRHQFLVIPTNG